jgi:hypothetical protein
MPPENRVYAELSSGEFLVPGLSPLCEGPDAYGLCPIEVQAERPCNGAAWRYAGARGWTFRFAEDSSLCPVAVLDPLGPMPTPQD